ncbi:hypothetical protein D3C87_1309980 [compost metagenome]
MKLLVFGLSLILASSLASACPIGEKETTLNVHRVMRNFGRYMSPAEDVAFKATNPYGTEKVQDSEITAAAAKLDISISCADAVLANPTGELLPDKSVFLEGKIKADYIESYIYFMEEFKTGLTEFRDLLLVVVAQKVETRDYQALKRKGDELNELINHAHKRL